MLRATPLPELIQRHDSTPLDAFVASEGSLFLLVEKISKSADVEKRFLTTVLGDEDDTAELWTAGATNITVFALAPGDVPDELEVTLGRASDNLVWLDDPAVSKLQLRFVYDPAAKGFRVSDMDSQNGTTLNRSLLPARSPHLLRDGDVLEISERYRAVIVSASSLLERFSKHAALTAGAEASRSEAARTGGLLAGKVAVITGAGRGLGRAYALRLAEEGCRIVVNDNGAEPDGTGSDPTVAAAVVSEIEAAGGQAVASTHDVSSREEVEELFGLAVEHFGGVDILVCSAGALVVGASVLDPAPQVWDRLMAINTGGTFACVQAAARHMVESKRAGRIIMTSSMVALTGNPGVIAYSASKAAVCGLALSAAVELAPHAITVNALTPTAWTRLTHDAMSAIPGVEELLSPRRVADVVLFLASELAAGITGNIVDVGGADLALYRTQRTAPLQPKQGHWTPQELQRRWPELTKASEAG